MHDHTHGPDGRPVPIVDETAAVETEAVETAADAEVEIARINAERDLKIARLGLKREELWQEGRVAELEAQVTAMRDMMAPPAAAADPEPEPEPVVVVPAEPAPEPEEELAPAPEPSSAEPPAEPKKSSGFWGPAYH